MNFSHVFMLTFTRAKEGKIKPVGVRKPMMPIPNKYAFTISLPGTFTKVASPPMIGIVKTAIPEEEEMNRVKIIKSKSINNINKTGGNEPARFAE